MPVVEHFHNIYFAIVVDGNECSKVWCNSNIAGIRTVQLDGRQQAKVISVRLSVIPNAQVGRTKFPGEIQIL